jgi:peptide-methionine (S)-S-oxide reductase
MSENKQTQTATFAGGCFWCTEAVFLKLRGVEKVLPGYTGGSKLAPTYEDVSSGLTGHAEAIQITFDPAIISYDQLLEVFFELHDPTTLDQQGYDMGTQYRSAVYYSNEEQRQTTLRAIENVNASGQYASKVVTEVAPLGEFYVAEDYHHNFYAQNPNYPYCAIIIDPKIQKLYKDFAKLVTSGPEN